MLIQAAGLVLLITLAGHVATQRADPVAGITLARARDLAASMALYRQAVIEYHQQHASVDGAVGEAALRAGGHLPSWAPPAQWQNHRDAATGIVYVFGAGVDGAAMLPHLLRLSQRSLLVGRSGYKNMPFQSALHGATTIALPQAVAATVASGGPLWLAVPT